MPFPRPLTFAFGIQLEINLKKEQQKAMASAQEDLIWNPRELSDSGKIPLQAEEPQGSRSSRGRRAVSFFFFLRAIMNGLGVGLK